MDAARSRHSRFVGLREDKEAREVVRKRVKQGILYNLSLPF